MKWNYFVSYAYNTKAGGSGNGWMTCDAECQISKPEHLGKLVAHIKKCDPMLEAVVILNFQLLSADQPTELEMHRADYQAVKAAGFQDPGELLAAYRALDSKMESVRQAIADYHCNLDNRLHGVVAQDRALNRIMQVLDMPWQQGAEKARRALEMENKHA